jgi:hypothetical protein
MIAADMLEKVAPASPLLPLLPALALPDIIFSWTEVLLNYLLAAHRLFHGRKEDRLQMGFVLFYQLHFILNGSQRAAIQIIRITLTPILAKTIS